MSTVPTKNRFIYYFFSRYYLQFEARKFMSQKGDVAIDDISMSPKCFGLGKHNIKYFCFPMKTFVSYT